MLSLFLTSYLITCYLRITVIAETHFINPPDVGADHYYRENVVFHVANEVKLQWTTDEDSYNVYLFQQNLSVAGAVGGNPIFTKAADEPEPSDFSWNVSFENQPFSLSGSNVFFLTLGPNETLGVSTTASSHYFNITSELDAATTTSPLLGPTATSPTPTTSTLTSTSSTLISSAVSTSTAPSEPVATASAAPSTAGSKIGLGVGLGVGIPLILLLGALIWFLYRRPLRPLMMQYGSHSMRDIDPVTQESRTFGMSEVPGDGVSEVPSDGVREKSELPSDNNWPSELGSS